MIPRGAALPRERAAAQDRRMRHAPVRCIVLALLLMGYAVTLIAGV